MPKITADIPEDLYRFVRGRIVDQRLEGEPTTVSTLVTDLLSKWKNGGLALAPVADGQQLRRRRGGALSSDPIDEPTPDSQAVETTTIGQEIDEIFKGRSQEERDIFREILVSIARQLVLLEKLHRGE